MLPYRFPHMLCVCLMQAVLQSKPKDAAEFLGLPKSAFSWSQSPASSATELDEAAAPMPVPAGHATTSFSAVLALPQPPSEAKKPLWTSTDASPLAPPQLVAEDKSIATLAEEPPSGRVSGDPSASLTPVLPKRAAAAARGKAPGSSGTAKAAASKVAEAEAAGWKFERAMLLKRIDEMEQHAKVSQ